MDIKTKSIAINNTFLSAYENLSLSYKQLGNYSLSIEFSLKALNLSPKNIKMQILNQLENDELLSLLAKYKFYISNSNFEGHPKSLLEAMSVGCVVFASNISNHIELIDHGKNGFLIDNNSKKIK